MPTGRATGDEISPGPHPGRQNEAAAGGAEASGAGQSPDGGQGQPAVPKPDSSARIDVPALHGRFFAAGLCALDRGEAVGTSSGNREEPASELPDEGEAETGADSDELGPLLAAIGEEVSLRAEAMRNLVRSSFDARMRYTRQTGPPHELAARIAGLKQEMRAALAAIGINADLERRGRQAAVRRERAGARRPKFRRRSPPTGPPAPRPF